MTMIHKMVRMYDLEGMTAQGWKIEERVEVDEAIMVSVAAPRPAHTVQHVMGSQPAERSSYGGYEYGRSGPDKDLVMYQTQMLGRVVYYRMSCEQEVANVIEERNRLKARMESIALSGSSS